MKAKRNIIAAILVLFLSSMACNLPSAQSATVTPDAYTAAAMTVTALAGTAQTFQPLSTSTPTSTPQPTNTVFAPPATVIVGASATPSGTFFAVDIGANCRTGPGINYDRIASFAQGSYVPLVGRNTDSTWWLLKPGSFNCWISGTTGHTTGSLDNVPVVQAPPTPTLAATATSSPTSYP